MAFFSLLFVLFLFKIPLGRLSQLVYRHLVFFVFVFVFYAKCLSALKRRGGENQSPLSIWLLPHVQIDISNRPQARGYRPVKHKVFNALHNLHKYPIIMH